MTLSEAVSAGWWVPIYFGNRFKAARLAGKRRRQQERPTIYAALAEAQAECDRLNRRHTPRE